MIGACLIVSFLAVLLLSNTVSANGPPIGEQVVELDPGDIVPPGKSVNVTIKWWITDFPYNETYYGPFDLKIGLKNDLTGTEDWKIHTTTGVFGYLANKTYPYTYEFTKNAPNDIGNYTLEVQIEATGLEEPVGKSGKYHPLLVASAEEPVTAVPEFATIAIPIAAILGLFFFFNHRKRKKS